MIRAAVLGADVSKSRSPAIHRAAFRALGVRGTYEAISVDAAGFDALVAGLRAKGFRYLNVTIPHKHAADALADARGLRGPRLGRREHAPLRAAGPGPARPRPAPRTPTAPGCWRRSRTSASSRAARASSWWAQAAPRPARSRP